MTTYLRQRFLHYAAKAILLALLFAACALAGALLTGCGGGDDDDEPQASTQPVNCAAHPEACK